jgi:hypothetical protein
MLYSNEVIDHYKGFSDKEVHLISKIRERERHHIKLVGESGLRVTNYQLLQGYSKSLWARSVLLNYDRGEIMLDDAEQYLLQQIKHYERGFISFSESYGLYLTDEQLLGEFGNTTWAKCVIFNYHVRCTFRLFCNNIKAELVQLFNKYRGK